MKRGNLPKSTEKYLDVEYCDETFEDINSDMQIPMQILMIMLVLFYTQEIGQLKHILAK